MDILGDNTYVEIPGDDVYELPPLLLGASQSPRRAEKAMKMAEDIVREGGIIPDSILYTLNPADLEQRQMGIAVNLVERYLALHKQWYQGKCIQKWVTDCELTFSLKGNLNKLLRPDLWPHAGRISFISLLKTKAPEQIPTRVEEALGLRLTFNRFPPLVCLTDQFLLLHAPTIAGQAFETWAKKAPAPTSLLPAERFNFQVVDISKEEADWI